RAPDAETVRLVLRQQGFAGAVVTPVELAGTSDPETLLEPEDGIVLELDTELAPAVDAACSDLDADALRIFTGRHGGKRIVAIEGREAAARADRLSAADVAAATSWRCRVLDPRQPQLVRSLAARTNVDAAPRTDAAGRDTTMLAR